MSLLKNKDLTSIADLEAGEILAILDAADFCKAQHKAGKAYMPLLGKSLGMVFHKPSARTRLSFELGIWQLGGTSVLLRDEDIGIGKREPLEDVARLFSRYLDGLMIRTFDHDLVVRLAEHASMPVINGLTDFEHPCQILADLQTLREQGRKLKGCKVTFVGDGNNVANSWAFAASKLGMHFTVSSPKGYELMPAVLEEARGYAGASGASIQLEPDPQVAVKDAGLVITDTWTSMGQEDEHAERVAAFGRYQVNEALLKRAASDCLVMHCLPAHRGEEISAEVFERFQKLIFDEAENRLHAQKGLMTLLLGKADHS